MAHRILMFSLAPSAGVQQNMVQIANYLDKERWEVNIATSDVASLRRKLSDHVQVKSLYLNEALLYFADWGVAQTLAVDIDRERYDVIHVHGVREAVIAAFAIARARHTPKLILTVHRFSPNRRTHRIGLTALCKRWLGQRLDHVITVSDSLRKHVRDCWDVPDRMITTIYNAAESQPAIHTMFCKKIFGVPRDTFVVGTSGRLVAEKGIDRLIDAVLVLRRSGVKVHLVVVGDGPIRNQLQKYASKQGLYAVHWLGERNDSFGLLQGFDVFVMPSHIEGLGVAAIEAMLAGVPVLASSAGGLPEVIGIGSESQSGGILLNNLTVPDLAEGIYQLLKNPLERKKLGQAGQSRAEDFFSVFKMVEQVAMIYRICLESENSKPVLDVHA